MSDQQQRTNRQISKRILVQGHLILTSPALFSSGDSEGPMDMTVLRDSISERALLPGSTLAGALRAFIAEQRKDYALSLFGADKGNKDAAEDEQSSLIIWDALSKSAPETALRDGVKISSKTRTAEDSAKYDLEVLPVGTSFELCFELLIDQSQDEQQMKQALAWALNALAFGQIPLGMKKSRGFGYTKVEHWDISEFDMHNPTDILAWLRWDHRAWREREPQPMPTWLTEQGASNTERCTLTATFHLHDSLMIRGDASHARQITDPQLLLKLDAAHLTQAGTHIPVIPGTSWAGVLRHRAEQICHTLGIEPTFVNRLFGYTPESPAAKQREQGQQSRVFLQDSLIENGDQILWVQNRIAIDRFTGGAYHGALFSEQPVWASESTTVTLTLTMKPAKTAESLDPEVGLILLLLKDLWTSDLSIGGEQNIGRGRLVGLAAQLVYANDIWEIQRSADGNGLERSANWHDLEDFAQAFAAMGVRL